MEYAFARNNNHVGAPVLDPGFKEVGHSSARLRHFAKHMPWIMSVMKALPENVLTFLNPEVAAYLELDKVYYEAHSFNIADKLRATQGIIQHVSEIYSHRDNPESKVSSQTTIFHEILQSNLPEHEKSPDRLWQDGRFTIFGGTLTTATTLSEITYHLLRHPEELRKLKDEIRSVIPDPTVLPPVAKLAFLP